MENYGQAAWARCERVRMPGEGRGASDVWGARFRRFDGEWGAEAVRFDRRKVGIRVGGGALGALVGRGWGGCVAGTLGFARCLAAGGGVGGV